MPDSTKLKIINTQIGFISQVAIVELITAENRLLKAIDKKVQDTQLHLDFKFLYLYKI